MDSRRNQRRMKTNWFVTSFFGDEACIYEKGTWCGCMVRTKKASCYQGKLLQGELLSRRVVIKASCYKASLYKASCDKASVYKASC